MYREDSVLASIAEAIRIVRKAMDVNEQDVMFVKEMIKHHEMAVKMANEQIDKGKNDEVISLAKAVIKAQQKEIEWMKAWMKDHGSHQM
jgi:uncharacterized protein (DUF305 family)